MLIDPKPTASDPSAAKVIAPELKQILTDLKLQIGQRVNAEVTQIVVIADKERQQLLQDLQQNPTKNTPAQKTLQSVLQDPEVKLVELSIKNQTVTTLTNLAISRSAQVQVLVTPRGLLVLPPQIQNSALAPPASATGNSTTTNATLTSITNEISGKIPVADGRALVPDGKPLPINQLPIRNEVKAAPSPHLPLASAPAKASTSAPLTPTQQTAITTTLAQALPAAQPLKTLLQLSDQVQQRLQAAPQLPPQSPLRQLGKLLDNVKQLAVDPAVLALPKGPSLLQKAVIESGIFYERRLVELAEQPRPSRPSSLADTDTKGTLAQLTQLAPSLVSTLPISAKALPAAGVLEQLFSGLLEILTPHHKRQMQAADKRQGLAQAVQQLVGKSLAQVQLQQIRTLSNQLNDPTAPAQWHLDIPLKLPYAYGNLYLNIVEPRIAEKDEPGKKRNKKERTKTGRWKVFMQLELDHMGELAAEISVYEKNVEATLWTEQKSLRELASEHLMELKEDLEKQGMIVKDLRCSQNPPPEQKIRLDYSLIDIKT